MLYHVAQSYAPHIVAAVHAEAETNRNLRLSTVNETHNRQSLRNEMESGGFAHHWREIYDVMGYSPVEIIGIFASTADTIRQSWPAATGPNRRFCNWVANKLV